MRHLSLLLLLLLCSFLRPAFGQEEAPENPLADATVGEWALYRLSGGMTARWTVIRVEEKTITLKREILERGEPRDATETIVPVDEKPTDAPGPKATSEVELDVKDQTLRCTLIEYEDGRRVWQSPDIPVRGLVKLEENGTITRELVDWGTTAASSEDGLTKGMPDPESVDPEALKRDIDRLLEASSEGPLAQLESAAYRLLNLLTIRNPETRVARVRSWIANLEKLTEACGTVEVEQAPSRWLIEKAMQGGENLAAFGRNLLPRLEAETDSTDIQKEFETAARPLEAYQQGLSKLLDWQENQKEPETDGLTRPPKKE